VISCLSCLVCLAPLGCTQVQGTRPWFREAVFLIDPITYGIVQSSDNLWQILIYNPEGEVVLKTPLPTDRSGQFASVGGMLIGLSAFGTDGKPAAPLLVTHTENQWSVIDAESVPCGFFALGSFLSADGTVHVVGCAPSGGITDILVREGRVVGQLPVTANSRCGMRSAKECDVMPTPSGCLVVCRTEDFSALRVAIAVHAYADGAWKDVNFAETAFSERLWVWNWDVSEDGRIIYWLDWDRGKRAVLYSVTDGKWTADRVFDLRRLRARSNLSLSPGLGRNNAFWVDDGGAIYLVGSYPKQGWNLTWSISFYRLTPTCIVELTPRLQTIRPWDDPFAPWSVLPLGTFSRPNGYPWPKAHDLLSLLGPRTLVEKGR
jgi:hypothetical protein